MHFSYSTAFRLTFALSMQHSGVVLTGKIPGSHGPWTEGRRKRIFGRCPKKTFLITPFWSTEIGSLYTRSCLNERVNMKESRQNNREIRVQDDKITETTNARSQLAFRYLL